MVGETAGSSIKAMAPNCTSVVVFFNSMYSVKKNKSQFYLRNNLDKAININFMKSALLNTCPFNITVCDKMGSTYKTLLWLFLCFWVFFLRCKVH